MLVSSIPRLILYMLFISIPIPKSIFRSKEKSNINYKWPIRKSIINREEQEIEHKITWIRWINLSYIKFVIKIPNSFNLESTYLC